VICATSREKRTSCRGNIEATTAGLRVGEDDDEALLAGEGHQARLRRVRLGGALAVVHRHDDGSGRLQVRRHVNVHAELRGGGIEVVDLGDRLAVANRHESGEDGES